MKIKIIALAAVFAAAMTTSACADKNDGGVLTVMGKESDLNKSYMTEIFERYQQQTGNKLKIISCKDSDFEAAAVEKFSSDSAPDILMHFHNADLNRFDVENDFYFLNGEDWVDDLTDSARNYCQDRSGNLLGLPYWENSVSGCYYNKTILDSLGLRPATNQAEFDVLCQALADTGYTPICWPADGCAWMVQFALDPIFADDPSMLEKINSGEITFSDIPEVENMVSWIAQAADRGWFGDSFLDCDWNGISRSMASGDAVMTFIWDTWFYTDLEEGGKYGVNDFALMPVFLNTVDGGTFEGGNLNMMMVNKNSERLEEALDFLDFCATPENYNAAFEGISTVSCFKGQTTNIQSKMVVDAGELIAEKERVSTAASRIVGYSADDMVNALNELFRKKVDVKGCVELMDKNLKAEAENQAADAF